MLSSAAARRGVVLAFAVASLVAALPACSHGPRGLPIRTLTFRTAAGAIPIRVEIAATIDSRRTGLMYRRSLASNAGMVFLWFSPVNGAFWMKNTLIPLSIAFWDGRGRIHTILDMQPCASEPCPFYYARQPSVGAVEVNQGFLAAHGVVVGDRVDIAG